MLPRFAVQGFIVTGPLFSDHEIAKALTTRGEDGLFESLILVVWSTSRPGSWTC